MTVDIAKALFRKMATQGVVFSRESIRTLKATYLRIALDFVETYHNDARMNGLDHDIHSEERAVELFAENLMEAGHHFLGNPMETPFIPSWSRVVSAMPDVFFKLADAVQEDSEGVRARNEMSEIEGRPAPAPGPPPGTDLRGHPRRREPGKPHRCPAGLTCDSTDPGSGARALRQSLERARFHPADLRRYL